MEENEKVGVFVFDSYFDVILGIEEKYKRWDLFEAIYRYVRFDQAKRLPAELSKIFKVLKPILDVQKKKIIRNEKRRKIKKVEGARDKESEGASQGDTEQSTQNFEVDLEAFNRGESEKIEEGKSLKKCKILQKTDAVGGLVEDSAGVFGGRTGGENMFGSEKQNGAESLLNKGVLEGFEAPNLLPIGEPNVVSNKNKKNNKKENKAISEIVSINPSPRLEKKEVSGGNGGVSYGEEEGERKENYICAGEKKGAGLDLTNKSGCERALINKRNIFKAKRLPSLDEVKSFAESSCKMVDAEQFFNYYSAKGWKAGGKPIGDWRACMIAWDKKEKNASKDVSKADANKDESAEHFKTGYDGIDDAIELLK